jgi:hypothetical protein
MPNPLAPELLIEEDGSIRVVAFNRPAAAARAAASGAAVAGGSATA